MDNAKEVPLADAAATLRKTWGQAWNLVLTGELKGRKKDGKWLVERASLRTYEAAQQRVASDPEAA